MSSLGQRRIHEAVSTYLILGQGVKQINVHQWTTNSVTMIESSSRLDPPSILVHLLITFQD